MKERCQLIVNTQQLAKERGLDERKVRCSAEEACDGSYCVYLSEPTDLSQSQIDKFFAKLEKWDKLRK